MTVSVPDCFGPGTEMVTLITAFGSEWRDSAFASLSDYNYQRTWQKWEKVDFESLILSCRRNLYKLKMRSNDGNHLNIRYKQLVIALLHASNPIKLDVFRCVPCYIPSNDPYYLL